MIAAVTTALGTVIDWIATVVSSLVGAQGALAALLPLLAVGVAISAFMLGKKENDCRCNICIEYGYYMDQYSCNCLSGW